MGPVESWPLALRAYTAMVMELPTPAVIFWGPDLVQIYNAGYAVIMGPRHPDYFGAPFRDCWPETYQLIYPWMEAVLQRGEVKQVERTEITLTRLGFPEEAYFTFTFSPLRDDTGAIAGILQPVVEVTDAVLADRRFQTLRALAPMLDVATGMMSDPIEQLGTNPHDIPFSLVYLREDPSELPRLVGTSGLEPARQGRDSLVAAREIVDRVLATSTAVSIPDAEALLGHAHVGPWPEPTRAAVALPLFRDASHPPLGVIVLGISPRLQFDDRYQGFFEAIAREVAASYAANLAKRVEHDLLVRERWSRRDAELQREQLVSLFTQAPTPIVVLRGVDMVIELVNPKTLEIWGRERGEVIGRPLLDALPELHGQPFAGLLHTVYTTGEAQTGDAVAATLGTEDVHQVFFTFVYAPLRDLDGNVDGVLVLAFDVTEQVRAREQVEGLRAAAEAANRAKDQFLAMLGHELRNPLSPILTAVELLQLRGASVLERNLDVIERQAKHLIRLVDDLLDLSRITRGQIELRKQRLEIATLVDDAVELMGPLLMQRQHVVSIEVPLHGLPVEVDPARIAQVLSNLLANAAKYTPEGGHITLTAERRDVQVCIRVRDTGVGIEPEILPHVFDMFVQAPQALDRSQGGLGLGLAIVRRLVEQHGGSVEARSEGANRGSEFVIWLPISQQPEPDPGEVTVAAGSSPGFAGAGRRILIVDDNEDAADLLSEVLSTMGSTTRVAHDGATALTIAAEFEPELALLDLGLPSMDGYELAQRLRAQQDGMHLVAVTGYGQESDRRRTRAAGFDEHLVKPVNMEKLFSVIAQLTDADAIESPR
ncbi:MAG: ATP-binding protein [Myxococcota bacterium]|nr:ATP-binding protein [Myxococcota bacterium]